MTPEQALANLDQARLICKLTPGEHNVLAESVKVLKELIDGIKNDSGENPKSN